MTWQWQWLGHFLTGEHVQTAIFGGLFSFHYVSPVKFGGTVALIPFSFGPYGFARCAGF